MTNQSLPDVLKHQLIEKRRDGNNDQAIASTVIGEVKGKNAIIFDDEIDTAGSIVETDR